MKPRYLLALAACCAIVLVTIAALYATLRSAVAPDAQAVLDASLREASGALVFLAILVCAVIALVVDAAFRRYVVEPRRIADEARLIAEANASHRVASDGSPEARRMADAVNALAARIESLTHDVEGRIATARRDLEEERTRLAALISELTDSVVACNLGGRVLLYNDRAQRLLSRPGSDDLSSEAALGLGRSLFTIFDRDAISHALEDLQQRIERGEAQPVSVFLASIASGCMVRVRMAPVLAADSAMTGFVLVVDDVTQEIEAGVDRDTRMGELVQRVRSALGNIGAAVDALATEGMDDAQRARFLAIVAEETRTLGMEVGRVSVREKTAGLTLAAVRGDDLVAALAGSIARRTGLRLTARPPQVTVWTRADRVMLADAVVHLAARLVHHGIADAALSLEKHAGYVRIELAWSGPDIGADVARGWQQALVRDSAVPGLQSFDEVLARHGGESWYARPDESGVARFCLLLPLAEAQAPRLVQAHEDSRPTFYDFDLFHQKGQSAELDRCALTELQYTVFDTETTGLAPSQGDEIVSIGAVRIVNGRLLAGEAFDQLVNPRRALTPASMRIHGITNEMVERAPSIERALPAFHRYCRDSVLVAHNAAFDLKFLQLKEAGTGVRFDHPVLDTLMLSAVLHPNHGDHTLEAIAARLGLDVVGRHTALGDALLTAEVFLKMIPLLRANGIVTLGEAREAASRTAYARVAY